MENKHTKGEWEVTQMLNVISKENGKMICATQSNMHSLEIEANAKLIAAAPDLLEAALQIKNEIDTDGLLQGSYEKLLEAIDKATK